jgi:signal transduction histidine kinase
LATIQDDIEAIGRIPIVATLLEIICRNTNMGFSAIARVTESKWVACAVRDGISFGLGSGEELELETTLCNDIRLSHEPIVIDHVAQDPKYVNHRTPLLYGFQSYISVPIFRKNGQFFGTLCAIDPKPNLVNRPETIGMFNLYADLIAYHLQTIESLTAAESNLANEQKTHDVRDQFIAILGHDLRAPLSAISMSSEMLKETALPSEDLQLVNIINKSAKRMSGLIDNILDFARARLGNGIILNRSMTEPLEEILNQVIREMKASQPDRIILAEFNFTEAVYCDSNRIAELFSNLLGNALAYGNPEKPVKVEAMCCDGLFHLSVTNSGPKIPDRIRERLFHPYVRGEAKPGQQGLGLGLYIASEIALAHDGRIEVQSTDTETRFTLKIPSAFKPG